MNEIARIQAEIDANGRLSLSPERERATPLAELIDAVASPEERPVVELGLARIVRAQLHAFPENIFWDLDYVAQELCENARAAPDFGTFVSEMTAITTKLMQLYGSHSPIRFRYVHDFVYGFDWARWVRKDPATRTESKPFGLTYLRYSQTRAYELLAMIAKNHDRYPTLPPGEPRNPFSFSREPDAELRLYRDLASQKALPIRAWDRHATPVWDLEHDDIRKARASQLGLRLSA